MIRGLRFAAAMAAALALGAAILSAGPSRTGAAVEVQAGPVVLALAAPGAPVRMLARTDCLRARCSPLAVRVRGAAGAAPVHLTVR